MNWNSKLPQSLTPAQLRRNCCMSTCRSAVPLRKGELLLQGRQLTARLLRQAEAAEIDAPAPPS